VEAGYHAVDLYSKLLQINNPQEEYKISKDLRRTLPEFDFFKEEYKTG
jgi:hypothetical protein